MKIRCFVLAVMIILQSVAISVAAETVEDIGNAKVIGAFDFEQGSSMPAATTGKIVDVGGEHKNVLDISTDNGGSSAFFIFDETVNSGKISVSYDIYTGTTNKQSYVRMLEGPYTTMSGEATGHCFEAYIIRELGYYQVFEGTKWNPGGQQMAYEDGKWCHMDMWFDFEERVATYYLNGELLGSTDMAEDFDEVRGFVHSVPDGGEFKLDNVYAVHFTGGGNDMAKYPYIMSYPRAVEDKISTNIEIPWAGHVYFENDIKFNVLLEERIGKDFSGKVVATIYADDGKSKSAEKSVEIKKGETATVEFDLKAWRYGYYEMEVSCLKDDGSVYGIASTRFSVAAPAGVQNPKMGFSAHFTKEYWNTPEKAQMLAKAGAWTIRDELRWTEFERNGVLGPVEFMDDAIHNIVDNGHSLFAILGYHLPGKTQTGLPRTEADLAAWEVYLDTVLNYSKDMKVDYELWNEPNMHVNESHGFEKDYVNLAKITYSKIKEINPDAKFYVMSTANVATVREYIETCLKMGIGDYCDGITIHPYNVTLDPEDKEAIVDVDDIRDLMIKYGIGDKELILSEYGFTSSVDYIDESTQANRMVKGAVVFHDRTDRIYWYNDQEKTVAGMSDSELHFGFLRGWRNVDIIAEAKPAFLAFSNYNRLMTGSEKIKKIETGNENISMHLFKNSKGGHTMVAWSRDGEIRTAVNVGVDTVTISDRYGNETVLTTRGGVIDITLTDDPIYIMGTDLSRTTITENNFRIAQSVIEVVEDDVGVINVNLPNGNWEVFADCSDNITVSSITNAPGGVFNINLKTGTNGRENEIVKVYVKEKGTNRVVYSNELPVVYSDAAAIETSVKYYKNSHWQLNIKVVNNRKFGNVSGKVVLTAPDDMILSRREATFDKLIPGETRYVYVNVPIEKSMDELKMSGYVELNDGSRIPFEESSYFVGLMHLDKAPTIDGKIDENEYATVAPVRADKEKMLQQITEWGGINDLSGTIYLNYDKDFFYLAARVKDNIEGATDTANRVWANDSIQFAFAEKALSSAGRTEIGIGKDNEGNLTIQRYSFLGTKFWAAGIDEAIAFDETCEFKMGREGNETIYELRMPWVDIYGEASPTFTKRSALFSIIINDNDGQGRRGWMEFCPGIGNAKNAELFMKIPAMQ